MRILVVGRETVNGLARRVAVLTGATGLIGAAIAERLGMEGAAVAVASRERPKAEAWIATRPAAEQSRYVPLELDVADAASIRTAFREMDKRGMTPSILIANALCREALATPFEQLTHETFQGLTRTDVAGHVICAREMAARMRPDEGGSIVFLSSIYAIAGTDETIYPAGMASSSVQYASAKAAMLGVTRWLAAHWGQRAIRVNAVIAGGVRSPARQSDEFVRNYTRKTMLGRMATAEEIASAVAFLASDDASYITGHFLVVDGGFTAW
jgi:NAD(P)-dependent dehydrogenase (short-subunit alcohol dehydrogenase family)